MRESKFQANLKKKLKSMFPGCIVTKMDPTDIQGMPDLPICLVNATPISTNQYRRHYFMSHIQTDSSNPQ